MTMQTKNNLTFLILSFLALALLILAYSNHFENAFHFDDSHIIVDNAYIRDIKNVPLFFTDNRTTSSLPANQGYRPVTTTTLAIDYWLGNGLESTVFFHISIFLWYIVQCVLMYFLFLKIFDISFPHAWNRYFALYASALYSVHAVNAETVNYICQRADVLSTLMVIAGLSLYSYLPKWRKFYLYLIPVTLGILSKEPAAMFAPLLFLYVMLFEKGYSFRDLVRQKNLMSVVKETFVPFIICALLIAFVMSMVSVQPSKLYGATRIPYLMTQPFVILHYFITFFLPFNLSADTDWQMITNIFDDRVVIGTFFLLAMLYLAFITSQKRETRPISFGILWFFLALAPSSSIIPLAEVMNDHRMFFPFVGLMMSVCWTLALFIYRKKETIVSTGVFRTMILLAAFLILVSHAYGTYQRNKVWHTEESLWYDVTVKSPLNGRGLMNYGLTQMSKGDYQKAEEYFDRALELLPYYSYLHINMGVLKGSTERPAEAERHFKDALQYNPQNPACYYYYALWLSNQNRIDEALPLLKKSLELSPGHAPAQKLMSELVIHQKTLRQDPTERAESLSAQSPTPENYLNLSLQYHNAGRYGDSIKACEKALRLKPHYFLAYNNICAAYNELGMWDKAIEACEKGLAFNPDFELMQNNLKRARQQNALRKQGSSDKKQ
jgi:tetratricopeptide (TPR) repeat protein